MDDAGGFELDVLCLEGDELPPAQAGPVGEAHGDRPPPVPEALHGVEQRRALLVGGQGRARYVHRRGALDGGGLGVADHPHGVLALGGQPPQPPGVGDQRPQDGANVLHQRVRAAGPAHRGDDRGGVGRGPGGDGAGAKAGQDPAAQQVFLLLPEPQ
ncbi:MAG TPA: hypothetical protein VFH23_03680 [Jiangellaceae bacterium]|nr:hypothetical protein [Jiangellaceae bacterium]